MPRDPDAPYQYDAGPMTVSCRRCGEHGLHWRQVTSPDGRSEHPVLFDDNMRRHVCQASADGFEVLE